MRQYASNFKNLKPTTKTLRIFKDIQDNQLSAGDIANQVDANTPLAGMTPLMYSLMQGRSNAFATTNILSLAYETSFGFAETDDVGRNALMYMAMYFPSDPNGYGSYISGILISRSNLEVQDFSGKTALMYAIIYGNDYLAAALIKESVPHEESRTESAVITRSANLNLVDKNGFTARKYADMFKRKEIYKLLKKAGAK